MPGIFGGDDVSAIVVDCGSSTFRIGWAGEDTPRGVIPTAYGWLPDPEEGGDAISKAAAADGNTTSAEDAMEGVEPTGKSTSAAGASTDANETQPDAASTSKSSAAAEKWRAKIYGEKRKRFFGDIAVGMYREGGEIASPLNDEGALSSTASFLAQTEYALRASLQADPREHPLMVTEPSWNSKEMREEMTEIAFEGLQVPAYYLANSTVLSAFAAGKPTALIVDVGENSMSAIPVVDGFILRKGIHRQPIGGRAVSRALFHSLREPPPQSPRAGKLTEIFPHYLIQSKVPVEPGRPPQVKLREDRLKGSTESFRMYHTLKVLNDFKEACAQVMEIPWDESHALQRPSKTYEFPDGYNDSFGVERLRGPEILFNPKSWQGVGDVLPAPASGTADYVGLADLALQAINSTDVDSRAALFSNVVCVGGSTSLPGLTDRLSYEISIKAAGQKIKIHSPGNLVERKYSSWIGGSILSSLGTFHSLWLSKQEYDEHGPALVHARCK
ncbi:Actin/actin-like protein [Tilletiaria anomala UBC 951]|uniref:Actin/actin-like protein n=1 Tax=Tilletiaria anomala (strain ATCC 24038 / CBS 436.72 / UBC 951) TaxID=1037660 RepID=A0A066WKI4_TILAU|nr:Actin/actin-like protein [Tilletiaria anomala UBC 951]KDN53088.1 Actin/actin-like protein [Tilletiaria anomala UBC 951]